MNSPIKNCPLTPEHCQILSNVLQGAQQGAELAQACVECDLPTQEFLDAFRKQADMAAKIKARFFPTEP